MSQKIANVKVLVPYKSSGGIIRQHEVAFDLFRTDKHYSLKPCLPANERQVANLPEELNFTIEEGKPVSLRGKMDGNFHVIQDAVAILKQQDHQL